MDLADLQRDWELGEAEVLRVDWRRQYRDLVLRIDGIRDKRLPSDPEDRLGFKRAVHAELTFVSCTRVDFDRTLSYANSGIEEWGSASYTIVGFFEDEARWPDREDLDDRWVRYYQVYVDDGNWRKSGASWTQVPWIRVACRDLTFNVLGPMMDELPMFLRP